MEMIEPNVVPLLWFVGFASISSLSFYVLAGAFPLSMRPEFCGPLGLGLILINAVFLCGLAGGALYFGINNLRWSSVVIVAGLAILFTPTLFNIWPPRWRDGFAGLTTIMICLGVSLYLLWLTGGLSALI